MKIKILMITFNRPHYTQMSLTRLCETIPEHARITIWDNNSTAETVEVVKSFESHPKVEHVEYRNRNEKLFGPTDWFMRNAQDADFLSKVDDDCLMSEGWCETLQQAHEDCPEVGVLGCWRFFPEDFKEEVARKKIQSFGSHQIMRNCWVEGSGFLLKKAVLEKTGFMKPEESFTTYCIRAAAKGFVNGWYYPFIFQEHMDDPRAENTGLKTEDDFQRLLPLTAKNFNVNSLDDWTKRLRRSAEKLQLCSFDPTDYLGMKAKVKHKMCMLRGKEYVPLVSG